MELWEKKKMLENRWKQNMSPEQEKEFEALFLAYHAYIYKYEVGDPDGWEPDNRWHQREDFLEQLQDEGMTIKVREGY